MTKTMSDDEFKRLIIKAAKSNSRMTEEEHKAGFAAPQDGDVSMLLRTAMSAIECGIKTNDTNAIAEGYALLEYAEYRIRKII